MTDINATNAQSHQAAQQVARAEAAERSAYRWMQIAERGRSVVERLTERAEAAEAERDGLLAEIERPLQHMVCDTKIEHEMARAEAAEAELEHAARGNDCSDLGCQYRTDRLYSRAEAAEARIRELEAGLERQG